MPQPAPFVRFTRDKRGYEHTYLVHAAANKRGKTSRPRVLYWFRTPPGIKVGRPAFDEEVQRAIEAQYPELVFDWNRIVSTPVPPPDVEHWRERRRLERAAKQARSAAERADGDDPDESAESGAESGPQSDNASGHDRASAGAAGRGPETAGLDASPASEGDVASEAPGRESRAGDSRDQRPRAADGAGAAPKRRRRRRGGRRPTDAAATTPTDPGGPGSRGGLGSDAADDGDARRSAPSQGGEPADE